ncbi:MAG: hypothetical protein E7561_03730 [Ruminococcaceae bacterium]|nr:hypothetical protein [Oscillospiraceae bacterium]
MFRIKTIKNKALAILLAVLMIAGVVAVANVNVFANTGTTYYVAADGLDTNDGLTKETPLSLEGINKIKLEGGDTVLLKRGDTFYGRLEPTVDLDTVSETVRVTVDAYGEGAKPIISGAKTVSKAWEDCGNGFYKIDLSNPENFTGLDNEYTKGNNGNYFYANVSFIEAEDGTIYGQLKANAEKCTEKYQFYCDDTCVYLKTDVEPYSDLGTCTLPVFAPFKPLMRARRGMIIKNMHFMYGGYGVTIGSNDQTQYVNIEDCIFEKIGGADIDAHKDYFTRGGNGIEFGSYGFDIVVKNNIFRDVYDVGVSPQGRGDFESPSRWENITITNNIFAFNTQAFETWAGYPMNTELSVDTNENGKIDVDEAVYYSADDYKDSTLDFGIRNLNFTNNLCIGQGEGWTKFREEEEEAINRHHGLVDILSYDYERPTWSMTETGNTYFHLSDSSAVYGLTVTSDEKYLAKDENYNIVADYNYIYVKKATSTVFRTHQHKNVADFKEWQALGQDENSTLFTTYGKDAQYAGMYEVAATSNDFDEIAEAAESAGVQFNLEYAKTTASEALEGNITANGATVSAAKASNTQSLVTVTLDIPEGKVLKTGGLTYTYGGKTYPIVTRTDAADGNGDFNADSEAQITKYEFLIDSAATNVTVNAEFVDKGTKNLGVIGTSVNEANYKLRFRSRVDRTYNNDGTEYQLASCGTLLFKEAQTDLAAAMAGIEDGTANGKVVPTTKLYDRTDNYYEYVCFIDYGTSENEHLGDNYYAYTYATYVSPTGNALTVYSDNAAVHSYNSVAAAIS